MKRILLLGFITILFSMTITYLFEDFSLEHVIDVLQDPQGQIVILQKESNDSLTETYLNYLKPNYNLIVTNKHGEIIRTYKLPKDQKSSFSEYKNLFIDDQNNIYLNRTQKNSDNYLLTSEEIIKISHDGTTTEALFKVNYNSEDHVEYSTIERSYIINHFMYIIQKNIDDPYRLQILSLNLLSKEVSVIKELQIDPSLFIKDILYLENEELIFSTSKGELFHFVDDGLKPIKYQNMPESLHPSDLNIWSTTSFAFYDLQSNSVYKMDTDSEVCEVLRTAHDYINVEDQVTYESANLISIKNNDAIAGNVRLTENNKRYVFVDGEHEIISIDDIDQSFSHKIYTFFKYFIIISILALLIGLVSFAYSKSAGSLVVKFSAVLLPMVILIPLITLIVSFGYFSNLAKTDLYAELFNISKERANQISAINLKNINGLDDYEGVDYARLSKERTIDGSHFNDAGQNTYVRWYYSVIYRVYDGRIHVATGDDIEYWSPTEYIYGEKADLAYRTAVSENKTVLSDNSDISGEWVLAVSPIRNAKGEVVGLLEVGTGKESYTFFIQSYYGRLVTLNIIIVSLVIGLMSIVIYRVILPLRNLNESVAEINGGKWGSTVSVYTHDEIGQLSSIFNKMSLFIKDYITELTALNEVYFKFIPLKFFELLDKKSIADVSLGNYSNQEMTIVYINTSNYFDLVKGLNSKAQLDLLNSLFEEYARSIHKQNGLVGEFRNAGVLALFSNVKDAMNASSMIMQRVGELQYEVKTTINIHLGEVLLGIVGDENRMTTAVISECVNEVISIDKYASRFNCSVIMTSQIMNKLTDQTQNIRMIGHLVDEQGRSTIELFEWLDTKSISNKKDFIKTMDYFNSALEKYMIDHFDEAKKDFIRVIKSNPKDLVSREYLYKCERLLLDDNLFEKPLGRF